MAEAKTRQKSKARTRATRNTKPMVASTSKPKPKAKATRTPKSKAGAGKSPRSAAVRPKSKRSTALSGSLGWDVGYRIVSVALNQVQPYGSLTPDVALEDILAAPIERQAFKQALETELRSYTTARSIRRSLDERGLTIGKMAAMVGSLPGKSGTRDGG